MGELTRYAEQCRLRAKNEPSKGKCFSCGKLKEKRYPINTRPDMVCGECWDEHGYEYDPTPW